ncbi:hypothetical protein MMC31_004278 [Peltigera leucophlebia]|nr:hypothetical protein [Peltigera leucophlebia]
MSYPIVSPMPTILIKKSPDIDQDGKAETRDTQLPDQHSWLQGFWFFIDLIIAHWNFISYVPIDIYFRVLFSKPQQNSKANSVSTDSDASQNKLQDIIGQLALHPSLPLLVVCLSESREIIFYNTKTCNQLQKFQIRLPKVTGKNGSMTRCSITCLKLSSWRKLAIGLSDGTVRVVEQNLRTMLATEEVGEEKKLSLQEVRLLPCSGSDISSKFIGPITNLVFPSNPDVIAGGDSWLAITTEHSGVWIWNEKTRQSVRVINTVGINQGCLHWISLSMKQSQAVSTLERNRRLNDSTHRKLGNIFGSNDNLSGLDEYYSTSLGNSTSSNLAKSPTPLLKHRTNSSLYGSGVVTPQEPVHDPGSLLIFGTKDGNLQVNKIFHSSRMMQSITSVSFYPAAIAQPTGTFQSTSGLASGEITHLVAQSHQISESSVTLPILVASKGDNSSILHQFTVSVLRKRTVKSNLRHARDNTKAALRSLFNLALGLSKAHYRWLPRSLPTDPTQGSITNHIPHFIQLHPISATATKPEKAFLISACTQPGTDLILTTLRLNLSSQCVIFAQNHLFGTLDPTRVNPLFPMPTRLAEPLVPSPSLLRGHYIKQLADAGLYTPPSTSSSSISSRRQLEARVGMTCVHDFACDGITWGKTAGGISMGAFIYTPASSVDNGVGIGMFEVYL